MGWTADEGSLILRRFRSKDAYARFTGTAPIPVWSGSSNGKVRLNRGGNRTLNTALHMIAVTQARGIGPRLPYLDTLTTRAKTRTEALRLLRPSALRHHLHHAPRRRTRPHPTANNHSRPRGGWTPAGW